MEQEKLKALSLLIGLNPVKNSTVVEDDILLFKGEIKIGKLNNFEKTLFFFIRKEYPRLIKNLEKQLNRAKRGQEEEIIYKICHEIYKLVQKQKAVYSLLQLSLFERFQFKKDFAIRKGDIIVESNVNTLYQLFGRDYESILSHIKIILD